MTRPPPRHWKRTTIAAKATTSSAHSSTGREVSAAARNKSGTEAKTATTVATARWTPSVVEEIAQTGKSD